MRKRIALRNHLLKLKEKHRIQFMDVDIYAVEIYMDSLNRREITPIIREKNDKFKLILIEILKGRYNESLYKKEDDCITAMRLGGGLHNSRIYCKEHQGNLISKKKVVMAKGLLHKSTQKNDKNILAIIESIKKYEYEFKQEAEEVRNLRRVF